MAVDDAERRRLGAQIVENEGQHDMLVHVGEIAGMKGVLIVHRTVCSARAGSNARP